MNNSKWVWLCGSKDEVAEISKVKWTFGEEKVEVSLKEEDTCYE